MEELLAIIETGSPRQKGKALEELVKRLFNGLEGFEVQGSTLTATEEIDICLINGSQDPRMRREGPLILVECKNWSGKCGRKEFSLLESKIRNRGYRCTLGFLISWNGFASTVSLERHRQSREQAMILMLTGDQIKQAIRNNSFSELVYDSWDKSTLT